MVHEAADCRPRVRDWRQAMSQRHQTLLGHAFFGLHGDFLLRRREIERSQSITRPEHGPWELRMNAANSRQRFGGQFSAFPMIKSNAKESYSPAFGIDDSIYAPPSSFLLMQDSTLLYVFQEEV